VIWLATRGTVEVYDLRDLLLKCSQTAPQNAQIAY